MNRFRERYNELLEIKFRILTNSHQNDDRLKTLTFIMQWCDQKATELELIEYKNNNCKIQVSVSSAPIAPFSYKDWLRFKFPRKQKYYHH